MSQDRHSHDHRTDGEKLLGRLEVRLGHRFKNPSLLEQALTHRSALGPGDQGRANEQLEFLGDAVLGLLLAEHLVGRDPGRPEGELSRLRAALVCAPFLAGLAAAMGLDEALRLGPGEEKSGGRQKRSILADALEAVLGAVYLDGGLPAARRLLIPRLEPEVGRLMALPDGLADAKTALQERLQAAGSPPPTYRVTQALGPPHRRRFQVEVLDGDRLLGRGGGSSKQQAQQAAARQGLRSAACQPEGLSSTSSK
ncbi:MAG: ribonuclease III [Acidobacteriota bacterium]